MRRVIGLLIPLVGLATGGCGDFMTDASTRLANDVVREANLLRESPATEKTFVHRFKPSPEGCGGGQRVVFQESLHHPTTGGSLFVTCREGRGDHGTTYHLNAVRVPVELSIEKAAGQDLKVTLRKVGGAIEVVRIE